MHYLKYTDEAVHYLKSRDKVLGEVIDRLGHIEREADDGLFPSIIHQIIAQQISNKAQAAVWSRVQSALGTITPDAVMRCGEDALHMNLPLPDTMVNTTRARLWIWGGGMNRL